MLQLAANTTTSGQGILCTLLLIGAVIASVLVLLALVGVGPWSRTGGRRFGGLDAGPIVAAVVLWILWFVVC